MSIFVTGGCGFVGSWVVRQLAEQNRKVIIYDSRINKENPLFRNISDKIVFILGDILDYPHLMEVFKKFQREIEGIIHIAAVMAPDQVAANPHYGVTVNTIGSLNLLEAARIFDISKVVCIGSGAVYGETRGVLSEEQTPVNPADLYGATKASTELFGIQYANHYGVDFRSARLFSVYGPGIIPSKQNELYRTIFGPLEGLRNLELEKGGDQELDYTYIKDTVNGVLLAYNSEAPKHRIFNISGGVAYKASEIIKIVGKFTATPTKVKIGPGRIIPRGAPLDISLAKKELGYNPQYDLERGISEYAEWLQTVYAKNFGCVSR